MRPSLQADMSQGVGQRQGALTVVDGAVHLAEFQQLVLMVA